MAKIKLKNRTFHGVLAFASMAAVIIGCGGGGGGGGSSTPAPTGNAAVRSGSLGSYQSLGAGIAFPFAGVVASSPAASTLHQMARFSPQFHAYVAHPADGGLTLVPELNLYTDGGVTSGGTDTFHYFSDLAGTQPAGTMVLTSPTGSFNYSTYPVNVGLKVNVTAGNLPCQGSATIKVGGPSGTNSIQGTLTLAKNSETVTCNLNLSPQLTVDGSISIAENGTTIQGTSVNGPVSGDLSLNVKLLPQGYTGTGTINLETSALTLNFTNPSGASCSLDSSGNLLVTYAGGTTETVTNPFTAELLLTQGTTSGATAGTTSGATTGTTSGSSAGTGNLSYGTPIPLSAPSGDITRVISHSADNKLAGNVATFNASNEDTGNSIAAYWPSPTSPVLILPSTTDAAVSSATGVNTTGVIVGYVQDSKNIGRAVVWTSPTAKPVNLPVPTTSVYAQASAINDQGNIVGFSKDAKDVQTNIYWASPTATTFSTLQGAPNLVTPVTIQNSGKILASAPYYAVGSAALWSSFSSATPTLLKDLSANGDAAVTNGMNTAGTVVGYSTYQVGPTVWAPPSYAPTKPMVPAGFYFGPVSTITSINSAGAFAGVIEANDSLIHTYIWLPGKNPVSLATLSPTMDGADVDQFFDNYSLLVEGTNPSHEAVTEYYLPVKTHP